MTISDASKMGQPATVEEMAAANLNGDGPEDLSHQLVIPGTVPKMSLSAGGERPTISEVTLRGGSIAVAGEFEKGEFIGMWIVARVQGVHCDDIVRNGEIVATKRKHVLRVVGVRRAEAE